jgi:hypothetical protein
MSWARVDDPRILLEEMPKPGERFVVTLPEGPGRNPSWVLLLDSRLLYQMSEVSRSRAPHYEQVTGNSHGFRPMLTSATSAELVLPVDLAMGRYMLCAYSPNELCTSIVIGRR